MRKFSPSVSREIFRSWLFSTGAPVDLHIENTWLLMCLPNNISMIKVCEALGVSYSGCVVKSATSIHATSDYPHE